MSLDLWLAGVIVSLSIYIIKLIRDEVHSLRTQLLLIQESITVLSEVINTHDKQIALTEREVQIIKTISKAS